jgi:hypothetical protein
LAERPDGIANFALASAEQHTVTEQYPVAEGHPATEQSAATAQGRASGQLGSRRTRHGTASIAKDLTL